MDNSALTLTIPTRPHCVREMLSDFSKWWRQTVPNSLQRHMAWHGAASWCRCGWNIRLPEISWDETTPCEKTQVFLWSIRCLMTLPLSDLTHPDLSITKSTTSKLRSLRWWQLRSWQSLCQKSIEVISPLRNMPSFETNYGVYIYVSHVVVIDWIQLQQLRIYHPKKPNIPQVQGTQTSIKIRTTDKFTISCSGVSKGLKLKGPGQLDQLESWVILVNTWLTSQNLKQIHLIQ